MEWIFNKDLQNIVIRLLQNPELQNPGPEKFQQVRIDLNITDWRRNHWVDIRLTEIVCEKDWGKVFTPEIDLKIDRGKVLTPRKDCKIDKDKVLGTNKRFLEKSRKMGQKDDKTGKKIKNYTLKMEFFSNYLTFRKRPWNRPRKVLYSWK